MTSQSDTSVPDWWIPERADPAARRLFDPTTRVQQLEVDRVDTAVDRIGKRAASVGIDLAAEAIQTETGSYIATGVDTTRLVTRYYRWTVHRDGSDIIATQERYFSAWGRYVEALVPTFLAVIIVGLWLPSSVAWRTELSVAGIAGFTVSLIGYFAFVLAANHSPDPFDAIGGTSQPIPVPSLSRILLMATAVVPMFIATEVWPVVAGGQPHPVGVTLGYATSLVTAVAAAAVMLRFQHAVPGIPDFSAVLPAGGTEYFLVTSLSAVPVAVIYLWAEELISLPLALFFGFLVISGSVALTAVVVLVTNGSELVDAFRRGGFRYVSSHWIHVAILGLGSLVGWGTLYLSIQTVPYLRAITIAARRSPRPELVALALAMGLGFLPGVYIWAGLLAQVVGSWTATGRLLYDGWRGRPAPHQVDGAVPAPVIVVPDEEPDEPGVPFATAISIGPLTWVLLGETLVAQLDDEELAAIAAHEYAHAGIYRDTVLSLLAPIIGAGLLVGQSAVLGLLDYRKREFRADRYAVAKTSASAFTAALGSAASLSDGESITAETEDTQRTQLLPTPALVHRSATRSLFSPIFDSVCVVEAHPSLSDRLAAIETLEKDAASD